jgi:hypothetical protein
MKKCSSLIFVREIAVAIPEEQLKTWSHQGSVQQSAATYQMIRNVLNDSSSPYYQKSFDIFLQGSYGNDTNVWADSDVDIVICLNSTYYGDTSNLSEIAQNNYNNIPTSPYSFFDFKKDVFAWLQKRYGAEVSQGKKALFIKGSGNRRDADVLVCAQHRRFTSDSNGTDTNYQPGICFYMSDGTMIENFPKQHSENCTTKHQGTHSWFKPVVRVYKSMRNRMIEDGVLKDGVAPSYFLEGMLSNVPAEKFGASYSASWVNTFNWVHAADKTKLTTASGLHWLSRDNRPVCWPTANLDAYLTAAAKYWNEWR